MTEPRILCSSDTKTEQGYPIRLMMPSDPAGDLFAQRKARFAPNIPFPSMAMLGISLVVLIIEIFLRPSQFDDFDSYSYIAEGLVTGYPSHWWELEPLSSGLILGLRLLTGDADIAIGIAHYALSIVFLAGMYFLARRYRIRWQALILMFAAFGPLLAFVTIRATPAYLLIPLAVHAAARGKAGQAGLLTLTAVLFHLSSLLAVPPLLVCYFQTRFRFLSWVNRRSLTIVGLAVGYGAVMSFYKSALLSVLTATLESIPLLGKYIVYMSVSDDTGATESGGASAFHIVYWLSTAFFVLLFMVVDDPKANRFKGYIIVSYLIFVFLLFSPVSAYRQSIFWMMPTIMLFPWHRLNRGVISQLALSVGCIGMFIVGFSKVLA